MKKILYNIMAVFTIMLILLIQLPVKANNITKRRKRIYYIL